MTYRLQFKRLTSRTAEETFRRVDWARAMSSQVISSFRQIDTLIVSDQQFLVQVI